MSESRVVESGKDYFPITHYKLKGKVVHGFGRGSKLLGFPTANLDPQAFKDTFKGVNRGVFFGYAKISAPVSSPDAAPVDEGVFKAMLSLGTNPHFETTEDTLEAYIDHDYGTDFYGYDMTLIICAYRRPQLKYDSLEALIAAIQEDVDIGNAALDLPQFRELTQDAHFQ